MHKLAAGLLALLLFGAAAGCTTNHSPGIINAGTVALQMAVGTLNDSAGTISALQNPHGPGSGTFLNVVETFRNQLGNSAFLHPGTAVLTGPGSLSVTLGSIFAYGLGPGANGVVGLTPTYPTPLGATPPYPFDTGFIYTAAPPTPGSYAINTTVSVNGGMQPYGAAATLPLSPTVLPAEPAPSYASAGGGGGTFTVTQPLGVTETLIVVFSGATEVATVETTGTTAVLLAGTLPAGSYTAFAIGADYPLVEAGPPAGTNQRPVITGAGGTADLTVSGSAGFTQT